MFADTVKRVVQEKQISKRFAAIAGVSFSSIALDALAPDKLMSGAGCRVSIALNPRFAGPNPIRA
jgi:hypothetical protein